MKREELKKKILEAVDGGGGWMTHKDIADSVGLSKCKHVLDVLKEMCDDENGTKTPDLVCQWLKHDNQVLTRYFSLPKFNKRLL